MIAGGVALTVIGVGSIAVGAAARRAGPPAPPPGGLVAAGYTSGAVAAATAAAAAAVEDVSDLQAQPVEAEPGSTPDRSAATHLSFPRMRIDTDLMVLDLNEDGSVAVPPEEPDAPAGWYGRGASPGESGPTVVLGHVDTISGPGVFYGLGASRVGDRVSVTRADGRVVSYEVQRVVSYPQDAFPTDEVYGPTAGPELRLITCGGRFDRAKGGYQDNIVVFATMLEDA